MGRITFQINKFWLALIALFCLTAWTHLYRIDQTHIFQNDEGRDVLIAYRMIDQKLPVLLGPETSVGNMYLGPFYYYLMVPSLLLSQFDPTGPAIMVALFGIATTLGLVWVGKKLYSSQVGLLAGFIYAITPVMVHYSRNSWNPNVVPFFALALFVAHRAKSKWGEVITGALIGILFQLHYVALTMPFLLVASKLLKLIKSKQLSRLATYLGLMLVGFVLTTAPFWLFEARHQWVNSRAFFSYLSEKSLGQNGDHPGYINRFVNNTHLVFDDIIFSRPVSPQPASTVLYALTFFIVATLIFDSKTKILAGLIFGSIAIVSLLKENIYVHYVSYLFPFLALGLAYRALNGKFLKWIGLLLLVAIVYRAVPALNYNIGSIVSSEKIKADAVASYIVRESQGRPYNVVNSQGSYTTTISYYLAKSSNRPRNDLQSLIYDICIGGPCPADDETTVLLFLTGPAHPSLSEYVGHPQLNEYSGKRQIVKNEWVAYDVWVATIELTP